MGNKPLHLDNFIESIASFEIYQKEIFDNNKSQREKIFKLLPKVIDQELTDKQKLCIFMYYEKNMNLRQIGKELGVYPSTVYGHIKKGINRLKTIIGYAFPELLR